MYDRKTLEGSPEENLGAPGGWKKLALVIAAGLVCLTIFVFTYPRKAHGQDAPSNKEVGCLRKAHELLWGERNLAGVSDAQVATFKKGVSAIRRIPVENVEIVIVEECNLRAPFIDPQFRTFVYVTPEMVKNYTYE